MQFSTANALPGYGGLYLEDYSFDITFDAAQTLCWDGTKFITLHLSLLFVVQLMFVINFFYSIWKRKKK